MHTEQNSTEREKFKEKTKKPMHPFIRREKYLKTALRKENSANASEEQPREGFGIFKVI